MKKSVWFLLLWGGFLKAEEPFFSSEIRVIRPKYVQHEGWQLGCLGTAMVDDPFWLGTSLGFHLGYSFHEFWDIWSQVSWEGGWNQNAALELEGEFGVTPGTSSFLASTEGGLLWRPGYGKVLFGEKIFYFETYWRWGLGGTWVKKDLEFFPCLTGSYGLGQVWFFSPHWGFRWEASQKWGKFKGDEEGWQPVSLVSLGGLYLWGEHL